MTEKIAILMATYNGEKYIKEQLQSLINQTYRDFHIYIRDDGSTDHTIQEIEPFLDRFPDKITLIKSHVNIGCRENFSKLIQLPIGEPYLMFCDQDDVWLPNKIQISLEKIKSVESVKGKHHPCLSFTDLVVVNDRLEWLSSSLWKYAQMNPAKTSLNHLLAENNIHGCTTIFNQALFKKIPSLPEGAHSHDWWLALVACAFGTIQPIYQPTILYRRHASTVTQASCVTFSMLFNKLLRLCKKVYRWPSGKKNPLIVKRQPLTVKQAKAFLELHSSKLTEKQKKTLSVFASLDNAGFFKKRMLIIRHRFWRNHFMKNLGLFANGQFI